MLCLRKFQVSKLLRVHLLNATARNHLVLVFYNGAVKFIQSISGQPAETREPADELVQSVPTHLEGKRTCLNLDLRLGNILLATTAVRNLLGLSELGTDGLSAEVLQRESLDGVDAQGGVGLDDGEATRHCSTAMCKLPFLIDSSPPFMCSWKPVRARVHRYKHTEVLLAATALLNDLDQTGLQLLDGGNVVGEDTHVTRLGGQVDLNDILGLVDGLQW